MTDAVHAGQLRSFVERIERLEEEAKAISQDKSEVYKEAKANGFDTKALKAIIAERRKDPSDLSEEETIKQLYRDALGA